MSDPPIRVPASLPGDPGDVVVALEVAGAVWEKGDGQDAIRWLMRAIEAAEDAGDMARAETLTRAVADLGRAMDSRAVPEVASATPPPAPTARRPPTQPPPLPVSAAPRSVTPPPLPVSAAPRSVTPPPLPVSAAARPAPTPPPSSIAPRPPAQPPAPAGSVSPRAVTPPPLPVSTAPHAPTPPPPPAAAKASTKPPPVPASRSQEPSMKPTASSANGARNGVEGASTGGESRLRVSVRRSALDPKMWVVRPLTDGHAPPPGAREGSLSFFGPDVDDDDKPSGSAV